MKKAITKVAGFTLIELIVVTALPVAIGLLVAANQIVPGR